MNKLWLAIRIIAVCAVLTMQWGCSATAPPSGTASPSRPSSGPAGDAVFARAFAERAGNLAVEGQGTVSQVLADDTSGERHQRFIVRLASGQTLLIAHNIDIAPRVPELKVGDTVSFKGIYDWNAQGGLVHWTHHDPSGSHPPGWIRHNGRTYE